MIFLIIFILEFVIKVIARGFVLGKFTYLRDPWNCFDLLIIIHSWVHTIYRSLNFLSNFFFLFYFQFFGMSRITAICIDPEKAIYECPFLCELRVLKICSLSLSLRRTISIYWQSLVKMRDLLLYILFAIAVISVMCLEMYMGILSRRCVKIPLGVRSDAQWNDFTTNSGKLRIILQSSNFFSSVFFSLVFIILSPVILFIHLFSMPLFFCLCNVDSLSARL